MNGQRDTLAVIQITVHKFNLFTFTAQCTNLGCFVPFLLFFISSFFLEAICMVTTHTPIPYFTTITLELFK